MSGIPHGTSGGYTNHGCRCVECRAAWAECHHAWKVERRRIGNPPPHVHGTDNGYTNYSCRCAECTEAHRVAEQGRRTRRRQPAA